MPTDPLRGKGPYSSFFGHSQHRLPLMENVFDIPCIPLVHVCSLVYPCAMYMHSIMSLRENAINLARLTTNPETLLACGSFCLSFFSFCLILMGLQLRSLTLFTSKVFLTISSPEIYVLVSFTYCLSVFPLSPI